MLKRSAGDLRVLRILNSIKLDFTTPPGDTVKRSLLSRHGLDVAILVFFSARGAFGPLSLNVPTVLVAFCMG